MSRRCLHACFVAALALPCSARADGPQKAAPPAADAGRPSAAPAALTTPAAPSPASPASAPAPANEADADQRAADRLRAGNQALRETRFADAERAYREAFLLKRGYDIAGDLAMAELAQAKHRAAAEHFTYSLRLFPLTGDPALRERMRRALDLARQEVSAVHVTVDIPGAVVLVDGARVGDAPLEDELFVEPGEHTVEARRPGFQVALQRVLAPRGGRAEAALRLSPLPEAAPPPAPPSAPPPAPKKRSVVPTLVLGGAAAIGLGAGAALLAVSSGRRNDAQGLRDGILQGGGSCAPSAAAASCGKLSAAWDAAYATQNAAVASFVVAGAAATGAVFYAFWPESRAAKTPKTGLGALPIVGSDYAGVSAWGSF